MVNTEKHHEHSSTRLARTHRAGLVPKLVGLYLAVSVVTLVVLGLLAAVGSKEATSSAWVHAVIVAFFAVLLEMRMRAARRGSRRASVAVLIIATVLLVANIIEAAAPGAFPTWMRFEMVAIAALMGGVIITSIRERAWR
jgi:peptidoglycan/LPS O-acetylase OafA/YrhL